MNCVYQYLYHHLSQRLQVDEAIIDYNLTRLDEAMVTMAMNNDRQYWTDEQQQTKEERDISFDMTQLAIALEIFLQTDGILYTNLDSLLYLILVDMLYMKTCSYRGAIPRSMDNHRTEGLFCADPPEARCGLLPCARDPCRCCLERRDLTRRSESAVAFNVAHYHKFLNGYQVILNCPAVSVLI